MSVLRTFTVTVANPGSGNRYYIDGVLQDTVNIAEGGTYRFDQSDSSNSGHPFRFSITSDGTHGGGSEYTTGVTTNGIPGYAGAYTEITVATSAPTLYYYCTNHSGMGGQANTPASDTYGVLPWGSGSWAAQGDNSVQLTGFGLNISEGNIVSSISTGWGALTWGEGEWGELKDTSVILNSNSLTSSVTSVTAKANFTFVATGIELQSEIGEETSGISVDASPAGIELQSNEGNVFGGELNVVQLTSASNEAWGENGWNIGAWGVGDGQTISVGDTSIAIGQQISPSSVTLTASVTDVIAGISITAEPTGEELTSSLGTAGTENIYLIGDVQADTALNSVTTQANADVDVTGIQITGATGQLEYEVIYSLTGVQSLISEGSVFGGELVEVQVTTASAQPWGQASWGDGQWGQSVGTDISIGGSVIGLPQQDVNVTGQELSSTTGNETITGDANLTLTGIALDIQQGDEDAFTNVRINVTGQELGPFEIGSYQAGISDTALPTGVTMTPSTGIMSVNAWELVDPGTAPTWTVVDKAA